MKVLNRKHALAAVFVLAAIVVCRPLPSLPETSPGEITFGPGPFDLLDPAGGLTDLAGYRATLTLSFDGTRDGQPKQWSRTYEMFVGQDSIARQLTIHSTGQTSSDMPAEAWMAEIGGVQYARAQDGACAASLAAPKGFSFAELWEPASLLLSVIGAEEAGTETVNGISANHYTFDESAQDEAGIAETTGEVWVAMEGYVVRYTSSTKGEADYFGEGVEGTITWEYELSEINQPAAIELPDDCPAGLIDAPTMPDAQDVRQLPSVTTFTTPSDLAAVMAFYQEQLPGMGGQAAGDAVVADTFATLSFTQGEQQLSVIATTGEGGTTVRLVLGKVQPAPAEMPGMPSTTPTP